MKFIIVLFLQVIKDVTVVPHTLQYLHTLPGVLNFPEFVAVVLLDDVPILHYDSNTQRAEPRQEWMERVREDEPQYWQRLTEDFIDNQQRMKNFIKHINQTSSRTAGVYTLQRMSGCEWDNETGEVKGHYRYGYNGEDLLQFDLPKLRFMPESELGSYMKAYSVSVKVFLTYQCPYRLKTFLLHGRSFVQRTALPSVSLLQKSPSSPVCCHASGFYSNKIHMFWTKDEEELYEGMEPGETLPNNDGTFQKNLCLNVSTMIPEEWRRYKCVCNISGAQEALVSKLERTRIRTNLVKGDTEDGGESGSSGDMRFNSIITLTVVAVVVVVGCFAIYIKMRVREEGQRHSDLETFHSTSEKVETHTVTSPVEPPPIPQAKSQHSRPDEVTEELLLPVKPSVCDNNQQSVCDNLVCQDEDRGDHGAATALAPLDTHLGLSPSL